MNLVKSALSFGLFLMIGSGWMLLMNSPGTDEFVVSLISLASGAALVGIAIMLARRDLRQASTKEDK